MPTRLPANRPFTTAEAERLGIPRQRLGRLVDLGVLSRLSRGRYVRDDMQLHLASAAGHRAARGPTRLVAAHETAAALLGLRTPQTPDGTLYFVCEPARRRPDYQPGTVILPAAISRVDITSIDGTRSTTLVRTALDLARGQSLARALIPIDHALALGVTMRQLEACRSRMKGWPGTRVLDRALAVADARSESALESMSRGAIIVSGLPTPDLQCVIRGQSGTRWRVDFIWPTQRVIGEADGFGKYATRGELAKEKFRDGDLRALNWTVLHWTFEHIMLGRRPALDWLAKALHSPVLHSQSARATRRVA